MAPNPKFEIKKNSSSQFYYKLKAINGENILTGEGYTSKQACLNGIQSVKTNAPIDSRYDKKTATNGQYYFNLKSSNGEVIGVSELYTTAAARDNGIAAVKRDAPNAGIEDLS